MWSGTPKTYKLKAYKILVFLLANSFVICLMKRMRHFLEDIRKKRMLSHYNNGNFKILQFENRYYWVEGKHITTENRLKVQ